LALKTVHSINRLILITGYDRDLPPPPKIGYSISIPFETRNFNYIYYAYSDTSWSDLNTINPWRLNAEDSRRYQPDKKAVYR